MDIRMPVCKLCGRLLPGEKHRDKKGEWCKGAACWCSLARGATRSGSDFANLSLVVFDRR